MKKKQNDNKELYSGSLVDTEKSYVETMIILSSGDTIKIVCEYIEFQEEKMVAIKRNRVSKIRRNKTKGGKHV